MFLLFAIFFAGVTSCTDSGTFIVDYLKFDDVVAKKVPSTIESAGTYNKIITGGTMHVVVKKGWFKVHDETNKICDFVECPASGYNVNKKEFVIPGIAPSGEYSIKIDAFDQDNAIIFCFSGTFTVKKSSLWKQTMTPEKWSNVFKSISFEDTK